MHGTRSRLYLIENDDDDNNNDDNDDDDNNDNDDHQYRGCTTERNLSTVTETVDLWFLFVRIFKNIDILRKTTVLSLHLCNTSFPPDVYQVDPVKEIWMKGKSQGKTRGWTHT